MAEFVATDLQNALFVELLGESLGNLARQPHLVQVGLRQMKPILSELAALGKAVQKQNGSTRDTMLADFTEAARQHPFALRWLSKCACLRQRLGPEVVVGLSEDQLRANFQALALLDQGL